MKFYRCRCGHEQAIGTMPPAPCDSCPQCLSDLAETPDQHRVPVPHEYVHECAGPGALPIVRCRYCRRTRSDIDMAGQMSATPVHAYDR